MDFSGLLRTVEVEIPAWMAACLENVLFKGAGHKYVRRVPTGNPKRPYKYFYNVAGGAGGVGHESEFEVGAAFKMRHGDKDGHFHVVGRTDDGKLRIRHDETGHEETIDPKALQAMLHREHAEAIGKHRTGLKERLKQAHQSGTPRQRDRLTKEAAKYGVTHEEKAPPTKEQLSSAADAGDDRSDKMVSDVRHSGLPSLAHLRDVKPAKAGALTKTQADMLARFSGRKLGFVSRALIFDDEMKGLTKPQQQAVVALVAGGILRVIERSGDLPGQQKPSRIGARSGRHYELVTAPNASAQGSRTSTRDASQEEHVQTHRAAAEHHAREAERAHAAGDEEARDAHMHAAHVHGVNAKMGAKSESHRDLAWSESKRAASIAGETPAARVERLIGELEEHEAKYRSVSHNGHMLAEHQGKQELLERRLAAAKGAARPTSSASTAGPFGQIVDRARESGPAFSLSLQDASEEPAIRKLSAGAREIAKDVVQDIQNGEHTTLDDMRFTHRTTAGNTAILENATGFRIGVRHGASDDEIRAAVATELGHKVVEDKHRELLEDGEDGVPAADRERMVQIATRAAALQLKGRKFDVRFKAKEPAPTPAAPDPKERAKYHEAEMVRHRDAGNAAAAKAHSEAQMRWMTAQVTGSTIRAEEASRAAEKASTVNAVGAAEEKRNAAALRRAKQRGYGAAPAAPDGDQAAAGGKFSKIVDRARGVALWDRLQELVDGATEARRLDSGVIRGVRGARQARDRIVEANRKLASEHDAALAAHVNLGPVRVEESRTSSGGTGYDVIDSSGFRMLGTLHKENAHHMAAGYNAAHNALAQGADPFEIREKAKRIHSAAYEEEKRTGQHRYDHEARQRQALASGMEAALNSATRPEVLHAAREMEVARRKYTDAISEFVGSGADVEKSKERAAVDEASARLKRATQVHDAVRGLHDPRVSHMAGVSRDDLKKMVEETRTHVRANGPRPELEALTANPEHQRKLDEAHERYAAALQSKAGWHHHDRESSQKTIEVYGSGDGRKTARPATHGEHAAALRDKYLGYGSAAKIRAVTDDHAALKHYEIHDHDGNVTRHKDYASAEAKLAEIKTAHVAKKRAEAEALASGLSQTIDERVAHHKARAAEHKKAAKSGGGDAHKAAAEKHETSAKMWESARRVAEEPHNFGPDAIREGLARLHDASKDADAGSSEIQARTGGQTDKTKAAAKPKAGTYAVDHPEAAPHVKFTSGQAPEGFRSGKVGLSFSKDGGKTFERRETSAKVLGQYAIHEDGAGSATDPGTHYAITHIPTGLRVWRTATATKGGISEEAIDVARKLHDGAKRAQNDEAGLKQIRGVVESHNAQKAQAAKSAAEAAAKAESDRRALVERNSKGDERLEKINEQAQRMKDTHGSRPLRVASIMSPSEGPLYFVDDWRTGHAADGTPGGPTGAMRHEYKTFADAEKHAKRILAEHKQEVETTVKSRAPQYEAKKAKDLDARHARLADYGETHAEHLKAREAYHLPKAEAHLRAMREHTRIAETAGLGSFAASTHHDAATAHARAAQEHKDAAKYGGQSTRAEQWTDSAQRGSSRANDISGFRKAHTLEPESPAQRATFSAIVDRARGA